MADTYNIHHGELLRRVIQSQVKTIEAGSDVLDVSRSALYVYFQKEQLPLELMARFGKKLNYDFSKHIPELELYKTNMVMEEAALYAKKDTIVHNMLLELDKWKTIAYEKTNEASVWQAKYYELLLGSNAQR